MKAFICILLLNILAATSIAQPFPPNLSDSKTYKDSIKKIVPICNLLSEKDNFNLLKKYADYGLLISQPDDHNIRSLFYFFKAVSFAENNDSAIYYYDRSLYFAKKANSPLRTLNAEAGLMERYSLSNKHEKEKALLLQTMSKEAREIKQDSLLSILLPSLANEYHDQGRFDEEINYRIQNIGILKRVLKSGKGFMADTANIGVALSSIGNIYLQIEDGVKAAEYFSQAFPYLHGYKRGLAIAYKGMMNALLFQKKPTEAKPFLDSVMSLYRAGYNERNIITIATELDMCEYYTKEKRFDAAEIYINEAQKIFNKEPNEFIKPAIDWISGSLYVQEEKFEKALPYLKASEKHILSLSLNDYTFLLQSLARCYAGLGQWEKAYKYYEEYAPLKDSLNKSGSNRNFMDAEAKFQNKEKQQQINTQKLQISYGKKQRLWLISGIALLVIVAILLVINYRNKKRTAEVLDQKNKKLAHLNQDLELANQTKAKLFGIISHDLRSPISQVYQFLRLQQLDPNRLNEEQRAKLNLKIQSATGSLLETMEDLLLWSKTQMNQFKVSVEHVDLMEAIEESRQLLQLNIDAKSLHFENLIPPDSIQKTDPNFLQTILRNLLQNAIKIAPDGSSITVNYDREGLTIKNSGGYFSQSQYLQIVASRVHDNSLSGLGLKVISELSEQLNIEIQFEETSDDSTLSRLQFH